MGRHIYLTASSGAVLSTKKNRDCELGQNVPTQRCGSLHLETHIEIEEGIHLVLNDGDRLEQLLCIHGPHHAVHPAWSRSRRGHRGQRVGGETERRVNERSSAAAQTPQQQPRCRFTREVPQGHDGQYGPAFDS